MRDRSGAGILGPVVIGSVLAVMIYAGGHISGGHYNPAVTLGVLVRGKTTVQAAVGYWVVQVVAAVVRRRGCVLHEASHACRDDE